MNVLAGVLLAEDRAGAVANDSLGKLSRACKSRVVSEWRTTDMGRDQKMQVLLSHV